MRASAQETPPNRPDPAGTPHATPEVMRAKSFAPSVIVGLLATVPACDNESRYALPDPCDRVGNPDFTGPGYGAIGPEGGVVEQTDPTSRLAGVRVEVPAGAWDECWEVSIQYSSIFSTPDYPDGFVPFERPDPSGAVDIQIGLSTTRGFYAAPDPLPIQLSFPMDDIEPKEPEVRAAYFFDDQQQTWRIVFPGALSPERVTIETSVHDVLWSWGLVDVGEVDYDEYLAPAMEDYFGGDAITEIEARLDEIRQDALEQDFEFDCDGLLALAEWVQVIQQGVYDEIQTLQQNLGCGDCNPLSEKFEEERDRWWQVRQWEIVFGIADMMFPPKKAIELVSFPLVNAAQNLLLDAAVGALNLTCDFDCYYDKVPYLTMTVLEGVYYGCGMATYIIYVYRDVELECPEGAAEPLLVPPG
jgi:hypothetical protein